jgi:hypothetical protein
MDADRLYYEYYNRRAEEERSAAAACENAEARERHLQLAAKYDEISASVAPRSGPRWLNILVRRGEPVAPGDS